MIIALNVVNGNEDKGIWGFLKNVGSGENALYAMGYAAKNNFSAGYDG
jgi:hypothetical protein